MKKAPRPGGAIRNRNQFHLQEEGVTMTNRVAEQAEKFDTDIHVGKVTIAPHQGGVMSVNTCPSYSWCQEDHERSTSCADFHMIHTTRAAGVGVLREEFIIDMGVAKISINEMVDWEIPVVQAPALIRDLRAELDRIEAAALAFMAATHPLVRHTEPGEPDQHGIGGGL